MGYQIGFYLQFFSLCCFSLTSSIPRFVEELGPIFAVSLIVGFISLSETGGVKGLDFNVTLARVILFLNLLMDSVFTIYWYKFMAKTFETRINVLIYGIIYIGMVGKMLSWNEVKFPLVQKKKEE